MAPRGRLVALEGIDGCGKSTQARLLAIWLRDQGYDVVSTHEPGATKVGMRLRALLLDTAHAGMSPRAEALMYAADRAEPSRYLVLDADRPAEEITRDIQNRIRTMLPDPVPSVAEANTGDFPAIKEEVR